MADNILDRINAYVCETCEIDNDDPDYDVDTHLFDAGFLDSLGAVELVLFVEKEFGIEISQKDIVMYPMNTVREIADVVAQKLGQA